MCLIPRLNLIQQTLRYLNHMHIRIAKFKLPSRLVYMVLAGLRRPTRRTPTYTFIKKKIRNFSLSGTIHDFYCVFYTLHFIQCITWTNNLF